MNQSAIIFKRNSKNSNFKNTAIPKKLKLKKKNLYIQH